MPRAAAPDADDRSRLPLRLAVLLGWTALGVAEAAKAYLFWHGVGQPKSWGYVLAANLPWWLLWAALTPVVAWVTRRFPIDRHRPLDLAAHLAAAPALVAAHLAAAGALYWLATGGAWAASIGRQVVRFANGYGIVDLVTYGAIVGACAAVDFAERLRGAALASARLEAQAARLRLGLAEARLQALRMELNPHFLFNALNAVSGLVRRREHDAAVAMLAGLGDLLSATLDRRMPPEIPLADELALLQRYLDVELVRFGDRLTIEVTAPDAVRDALVPPLLLQPLVENAIRHGVARRPGPASIRLSAERAGDDLQITVRDTGEGPRASARRAAGRSPRPGIGLANARARLAELYGPAAALGLAGAPGGGAVVRIRLPFHASHERTHGDIAS